MANRSPVKDRQDIPIWNAIEANNLKQALKLVDKRLAKKPTDYLQALKIYIRSQSPSTHEKTQVLVALENLPARKPPLVDSEAVDLYDEALGIVLPGQQESWAKIIGELRFQGVKSSPKDESLGRKCLHACLSKGDLDHARQIAISLEKNFPNVHAYVFWGITMTFLYSKSPSCPEGQRGIFGKLALAQISKLATTTTGAGSSSTLPIRSIQTPQEILLLHLITAKYGTQDKRLEYLRDPYLGPESTIAKGEWSLWRDKLQLMVQTLQWQELFRITGELLRRARTKDESGQLFESRYSDWVVWDTYIQSALEISPQDNNIQVVAEIQAHLDPNSGVDKSWRRNASLGWLKFSFETSPSESDVTTGKLPLILTYLEKYGEALTAYNDIRPFVERLTLEDRAQLVRFLTGNPIFGDPEKLSSSGPQSRGTLSPLNQDFKTANTIAAVANKYKVIYLLTSSHPEYERINSPQYKPGSSIFQCKGCDQPCGAYCENCLGILARSAMQSYGKAISNDDSITKTLLSTDRHPADDLCVLSAMCLVKLAFKDDRRSIESLSDIKTSYILQAIVLLEYAWPRSKSNFQISLLLVSLYSFIGCGSLAMRAFQHLGVKQIQLDTLSHILFDRISSLHPHSFSRNIHGSQQLVGPMEHLEKQQKVYRKSHDHVSKNCGMSLEHGSYNSVFQIKEFEETLSLSMSSAMSVVESRRISRLTLPNVPLEAFSSGYDTLGSKSENSQALFCDTNDYESYPNFEASKHAPFGRFVQLGLGPSTLRSHLDLVAENLMLIINPTPDWRSPTAQLWLKHHLKGIPEKKIGSEGSNASPASLTKCEAISMRAHEYMVDIILRVIDQEQSSEPELAAKLEVSNKLLYDALEAQLSHVAAIEGVAPAVKSTLHSLYVTYELGTTVIAFNSHLSRVKKDVYNILDNTSFKSREIAKQLLQTVIEKSTAIKSKLDEGGWIDKVLESVSQDGQAGTDESHTIAGTLKGIVDENFMEEWAGHLLESWQDSVVGFSYFKAPTKG